MLRSTLLSCGLIVLGATAAHAQDWMPYAKQCGAYAEAHASPGTADPSSWEWLSACTAQNYFPGILPNAVNWCIAQVTAEHQPFIPAAGAVIGIEGVVECLKARGAHAHL